LLISDYMSRQVLNAVFPALKLEWSLTDTRLGALGGIVALMVGLLTFPLSLLADRWDRVKSLALMALVWSLATLACGLAHSYNQMFAARFLVGVGEAAYGSVGIAVVFSVFPKSMRSTLGSAFMAGGTVGSVLGISLGGILAAHFGWRIPFVAMAGFGLVLALAYPKIVHAQRPTTRPKAGASSLLASLRSLFSGATIKATYVGSGLQLLIAGAMPVWLPSYLSRFHHMATDRAAVTTGVLVLCAGVGMVLCGMLSDRLSRHRPQRKAQLAVVYSLASAALLFVAFSLPPDNRQGRTGNRDRRGADEPFNPRLGVRHFDPRQQRFRTSARPAHHRNAGRPV
jgi:predicted MFS family arabinose efflux permease